MSLYIILMGPQGAGKGVQAKLIQERYGIPQISTGDLLRAMRTREDELAKHVQDIMARGMLVDDETTNAVLKDRLEQPDAANGAIFDGYPRNPSQAQYLENYLSQRGARITAVLLLDLDLFTAFKRAFGRITSANGTAYNIYSGDDPIEWEFVNHPNGEYPPQLQATLTESGEKLIRRPDDASAHAIIKRIDTFLETTRPLIDYFNQKGLVEKIDAEKPIEEVSEVIFDAIKKRQQRM